MFCFSGSGRSFTQEDGEALEEDLQALIDLFSLNLNNCCGCQLSFEMVENVAASQRSIGTRVFAQAGW